MFILYIVIVKNLRYVKDYCKDFLVVYIYLYILDIGKYVFKIFLGIGMVK